MLAFREELVSRRFLSTSGLSGNDRSKQLKFPLNVAISAGDNVWQGATRSEGGFKPGQVSLAHMHIYVHNVYGTIHSVENSERKAGLVRGRCCKE